MSNLFIYFICLLHNNGNLYPIQTRQLIVWKNTLTGKILLRVDVEFQRVPTVEQ